MIGVSIFASNGKNVLHVMNKSSKIEKLLGFCVILLLVFMPWQAILITRQVTIGGSLWQYATLGLYATEVLLGIATVLWIIWIIQNGGLHHGTSIKKWSNDRLFILFFLFFVSWIFLSSLWSLDPLIAIQTARRVLEAGVFCLIVFTAPISLRMIVGSVVAGSIFESIFGMWQFLSQSIVGSTWLGMSTQNAWVAGTSIIQSPTIGRWVRAYGTFSHPNVFGGFLVIALIASFIGLSIAKTKYDVLFFVIASVLQTIALFFTFSRTAWIATAVFVLFILFSIIKKQTTIFARGWIVAVVLSFLVFSFIFSALIFTRVSDVSVHEQASITERMTGYHDGWQLFLHHTFFGVGAGNVTQALHSVMPLVPIWFIQPIHDVPFLILIEVGLVGVLFLCAVLFFYYRIILNMRENQRFSWWEIGIYSAFFVLLLPDHYLWSSYIGLFIAGFFFGFVLRISAKKW